MKYSIRITQKLEGYIEVEADNSAEALQLAGEIYNGQGHDLPEMEDCNPLEFELVNECSLSDRQDMPLDKVSAILNGTKEIKEVPC